MEWNATREELRLIHQIVDRIADISASHGITIDKLEFTMDLEACHSNGCPLDLAGLLASLALDFTHDVYGIARNLDRETGRLLHFFLPRYAARHLL